MWSILYFAGKGGMKKMAAIRKPLSRVFILAGLALVLTALAFEAYSYPWGTLFGGVQSEASTPDPAPIVLKGEDKSSIIVQSESGVSSSEPAEIDLLPGEEAGETLPVPVYVRLGILKIPKLGISQYVLEGTQRQLRYGVGHVEGSAGIGQKGNCVIAGHRSTPFRYMDKLAAQDSIILKANGSVYTYSVYDRFTVLPDETWVLGEADKEEYALTLITCTPYLVSSHRLIVRATLAAVNGMAPEEYSAAESAVPEAEIRK